MRSCATGSAPLALIEKATGKAVYQDEDAADIAEAEKDDDTAEAEFTMAA